MTSVSTVDQYNHTGNHHLPVVTSARVVEVVSEVAIQIIHIYGKNSANYVSHLIHYLILNTLKKLTFS